VLEFRVTARVRVKVSARIRYSWGTKRLGTKRLGYEMSGSRRMLYPAVRYEFLPSYWRI